MPLTPFHFGPCALIALPIRRYIDLPVFILVNLYVDIEPYRVIFLGAPGPEHALWHTYTVGSLVGLACAALSYPLKGLFGKIMNRAGLLYETSFFKMLFSSLLGVWFHVTLDGILYSEMMPFYPLVKNPLYGLLSIEAVYILCTLAFIPAFIFYRKLKTKNPKPSR
jgi:hypothetical protein